VKKPALLAGWAVVILIAGVFVRLGLWQLDRLDERRAENDRIEQRLAERTLPLAEALAAGGDLEYRHAVAVGEFIPADEVLLRNRTHDGQNGFHVLTPMVLTSGEALLVDRGWIPIALDTSPVVEFAPSEGTVEIVGILRNSRKAPAIGPTDPVSGRLTQIFWPDLERLAPQMPQPLAPAYLELRSQVPLATTPQPLPAGDPILTDGPHLSYAVQWFSFAVIVLAGYLFLWRRRRREKLVRTPAYRD